MKSMSAVLTVLTLSTVAVLARDRVTLGRAWQEYEYQNFTPAGRMFSQLVKESPPGSNPQLEARIGLAMIVHYRMPGGDPRKAMGMYQELLTGLDSASIYFPTLLVSMGKACMALPESDTAGARRCYETVLRAFPSTVEADQAAMELAQLTMYVQDEFHFRQAIAYMTTYLDAHPDNLFAGAMLGLCAQIHLLLRDYAEAREALIRQYDSGKITSMYEVPTVLFQIAMISESKLKDYETAKKYYRIIIDQYPIDSRLYVCELRYRALEEITRAK